MNEQHKCDWGPWHPWCSTYRCIHPGCHKNMPSAEVAKRLNEYEPLNNINADLLEALKKIVDVGTNLLTKEDGVFTQKELGEAYSQADRIARKAIRKAKSHADTLKGDDTSDLIKGLERACDLFDDIQERKAKEKQEGKE